MDHLDHFAKAARKRVERGYYHPRGIRGRGVLSLVQRIAAVPGNAVIAEVKPRSPMAGDLLKGRKVVEIGAAYREGGAVGISVLVDPDYFGGSLENLRLLAGLGVPLLAKDFVVEPCQLEAYFRAGADCVLLIMTLFARGYPSLTPEEMIARAHGLGLEVLLEVSSADELEGAIRTEADLIGVNSRDLATLKVSLERTAGILREVRPPLLRPVLALSGITCSEELRQLRAVGYKGFLVGSSLLVAEDPQEKLRELVLA